MFVYSYSIRIHASGIEEFWESIFCLLLLVEAFSLQKVGEMLEEVVVSWREVRWVWPMRQNFIAQFVQLWKHWLCDVQSGVEKNWALSLDHCRRHCRFWCISLMCWDCFSNVMVSLAFRKLDQTISRSPNRDHDLSFGASLALKSALELLLGPVTEQVVASCRIKSHFLSHVTIWSKMT